MVTSSILLPWTFMPCLFPSLHAMSLSVSHQTCLLHRAVNLCSSNYPNAPSSVGATRGITIERKKPRPWLRLHLIARWREESWRRRKGRECRGTVSRDFCFCSCCKRRLGFCFPLQEQLSFTHPTQGIPLLQKHGGGGGIWNISAQQIQNRDTRKHCETLKDL